MVYEPWILVFIINMNEKLGRSIEGICYQESSSVFMSCDSPFGVEKAHSYLYFINLALQIFCELSQGINPDIHLASNDQTSAVYLCIMPSGMENANIKDVATVANISNGA